MYIVTKRLNEAKPGQSCLHITMHLIFFLCGVLERTTSTIGI